MLCNTETIRAGEINNDVHSSYIRFRIHRITKTKLYDHIDSDSDRKFKKNIENASNKNMECQMLLL